jgi:predicted solute-binding protein
VAKRLGIIAHRYAQPLFLGLRTCNEPLFDIVEDAAAQLAIKLRQQQLDGAFLSPIDYAKDYSMYRIVPGIGAVSEGESGLVSLVFKEHTREIKTVAIDPSFTSEIVLTSLILSEKFDVKPTFVPFVGGPGAALSKADACLVVGDAAQQLKTATNKLDLVDEWFDITELPYVHGMWVVQDESMTQNEIETLTSCSKSAISPGEIEENSGGRIRFNLDETAKEGMNEFFRMAYYHGILKDIPDVKFIER